MAKLTQDEILAYLDEATILELNELVKAIEEKYGVSAAAPVAVAAAPAAEADAAPKNVTVVMSSFGDSKVAVIKVVREITGLGLVVAKIMGVTVGTFVITGAIAAVIMFLLMKLKRSRSLLQMQAQLLNLNSL